MKIYENYPCKKVMIGFLLSPFVSGSLLSLFSIVRILFDIMQDNSLIGEIKSNEIFAILIFTPIIFGIVFIPSSFATGIFLCFFKLKKTLRNIIFTSFFGGLSAVLWTILPLLIVANINQSIKNILFIEFTPLLFFCFLLHWIGCFIISALTLPSNKNINKDLIT